MYLAVLNSGLLIKQLFNTFTSKVGIATLNFFMGIMVARLSPEIKADQGIFITNMQLAMLINNLIGGGSIVFLTPRMNLYKMLIPSYIWTLVTSPIVVLFIYWGGQIPLIHIPHLIVITCLYALFSDNLMVLLGKKKIELHNKWQVIQVFILLFALITVFYVLKEQNVMGYIKAMYVSLGTSFIATLFLVLRIRERWEIKGMWDAVKATVRYGFMAQLGNILQFINYRLSYYFMNIPVMKEELGVFSVTIQLAEAIWIIGRSFATVQYANVSNTTDDKKNITETIRSFKSTFLITLIVAILLICIPGQLYVWIYNDIAYFKIASVLKIMFIGLVCMGTLMAISPYFGGIGKYQENLFAAFIAAMVSIGGCIILVPKWGIYGAATTATCSYIVHYTYIVLRFCYKTKTPWKQLLISREDFRWVISNARGKFRQQ